MDLVYFTVVAIGIYFGADWLLDSIERRRGARFQNRQVDRKSTRLNSSHIQKSRMPSSA